ncbi:putative secreted hydrolase [metagenome]|uniref:Putative secreted hydrolase n=1 Tax=metagenome TaxID=256318 RepID=A0A2P2CJW7_9ZZZZ
MKRTSARLAVLGSALVGLLCPLLLQPAQAAAPVYVALGDSYASGTGTRSYISDGTSCQRSTRAYPSLIAAARGYALNFRACSGARIGDVTSTQLSALTTATNYVTISVGGNDAGFADVLTECALPGWASNCNGKINTAQAYITNTLPSALATLYAGIRSRAPYAKVVVVGYPRIFNGEDCNAFTWFSPTEEARLNQTADLINARTAAAAAAAGFSFADPTSAFVGHAVCDDPEYLNGLSSPISESYHPNVAGHASGYTPVVSTTVGGAFAVTAKVRADAAASARSQAALQRQYAAADRSITPESFVAPDLTTPEVRRAARRAGIDLDAFIARSARR